MDVSWCVERDHNRFAGVSALSLSKIVRGAGPDLFMLHGWSMHSAVFGPMVEALAKSWRVTCIDLPGYGINYDKSWPENLESLTLMLLDSAPSRAAWMGWSLGGLPAIHAAAMFPERVKGLVLLAATPRFIADVGWHCALPRNEFSDFVRRFERNPEAALARFDQLQFRGDSKAGEGIRQLRRLLGKRRIAYQSLRDGLRLLDETDLRACLGLCQQPVGVVFGDKDALIPDCYGHALLELVPHASVERIQNAGHAPFITHMYEVRTALSKIMEGFGSE